MRASAAYLLSPPDLLIHPLPAVEPVSIPFPENPGRPVYAVVPYYPVWRLSPTAFLLTAVN